MDHLDSLKMARLAHGNAAAAFTTRPPSPPAIMISALSKSMTLDEGSGANVAVDANQLTPEEYTAITGGQTQMAQNTSYSWTYEMRRAAQPVLDYIYLGPFTVARDRVWLEREGITMVLLARDAIYGTARSMLIESNCGALGIAVSYLNIAGKMGLSTAFSETVRRINEHMLEIYRSQSLQDDTVSSSSEPPAAPNGFRRGKVLVCCESGNERSAALVAAYIIAMFGSEFTEAVQFVIAQRFCVSIDEDSKRLLRSFHDVVQARRQVRQQTQDQSQATQMSSAKRTIDDSAMAEDDDADMDLDATQTRVNHDEERYVDRPSFAPFLDDNDREEDSY